MLEKPAKTSVPVNDIIARRWSGRAFDEKKKVERKQLIAILEAARWAPSCYGDQPWRYIVWVRSENEDLWRKAFDCLSPFNQAWVSRAPVLIASLAGSKFRHNGQANRWGQHDTGAASENLCLEAVSQGLMAHQMGGFDPEKLRSAFKIPAEYTPMAMIAVGWPMEEKEIRDLPAERRDSELQERERLPLKDLAFDGEWGRGVAAP